MREIDPGFSIPLFAKPGPMREPDELHSEGWLGEKAFGPDVYRSNETI